MSTSGDTLFRLECVLLFALDVVKGPYIHSCAPVNPSELIRSFLQPPAAAAAAAAAAATAASTASASGGTAANAPGSPLRKFSAVAEEGSSQTAASSTAPRSASTIAPSGDGGSFAPSSLPQGSSSPRSAAALNTSPLLGASGILLSSPPHLIGTHAPPFSSANAASQGTSNSFTAPSSFATAARAGSTTAAASTSNTPLAWSAERAASSSSLLAQRRLLGLGDGATPDDARGIVMGSSAPNNASASEETNTLFAISPQTNLSESQHTLPSVSPMAGSFAGFTNASMTSNTGGGSNSASAAAAASMALRHSASGQGLSDGGGAATAWMARPLGVEEDSTGTNGNGGTPAALRGGGVGTASVPSPQGGPSEVTGRTGNGNTAHTFRLDSSSSPLATPLHTPPITAALAGPGMRPEPMSVATRRTSEGVGAEAQPHGHQSQQHGPSGSSRGAYAGPAMTASSAGAGAEDGRINSYNDVFVPRSEFCRRVLWLYPAESGLLFVYYAEDIPGEHYQRKTLRYSICLVFCVDEKRMTIGAGLLHHLVRPYSVVLTNIAEELREAEVKHAYMSRGLQAVATPRRPPAPRHLDLAPLSSAAAATTPSVAKAATTASSYSAAAAAEEEEEEEGDDGGVSGSSPASEGRAAASATATQKTFRFGRRRVVNESSARPDTYRLALVERSVPATMAATAAVLPKTGDTSSSGGTADSRNAEAPTDHAEATPTSFMSPLPPHNTILDGEAVKEAESRAAPAAAAVDGGSSRTDASAAAAATAATPVMGGASARPSTAADAASAMAGSALTSTSPSYVLTSRTTTGTTPSSHFGTPFSPPATESTGGANAAPGPRVAAAAAGAAAESSSASAVSPSLADTEALTVTPPSSLPLRSRTVSHGSGAGCFQPSSAQSPAFGDSVSTATATTATTAPSPLSCMMATSGAGGVAGPFPSAAGLHFAKQPPHLAATASSPQSVSASSLFSGSHTHHRSTAAAGGGEFGGSHTPHSVNTLNAFITPTTAPQWTPLSELVEELYRCLRANGDGEGSGDASAATTGASTTAATIAGAFDRASGGSLDASLPASRAAYGAAASAIVPRQGPAARRPVLASPVVKVPAQQQQQQPLQRAGTRQMYSPLTTALAGDSRQPSWTVDGGDDARVEPRGGSSGEGRVARASSAFATSLFPRAPASIAPSPRGDVSVVHLSDRLSFHVRRMAPLQPARMLHFDHVPVPVVPYDASMLEWMDMAVHHVFRLVDGVRTVADLVFDVAMGTTTTLAEVYTEAVRRSSAQVHAEAVSASVHKPVVEGTAEARTAVSSVGSRDRTSSRGSLGSAGGRGAGRRPNAQANPRAASTGDVPGNARDTGASAKASVPGSTQPSAPPLHARVRIVSVPIEAGTSLNLLPGVRYSMPTSAAAAAAAAAISDGQAPPPSHVNVRVAPSPSDTAYESVFSSTPAATSATAALSKAVPSPSAAAVAFSTASAVAPPNISVELPMTWVATTGIVVEALLHLELCHLIKVYRPWTEATLYSATVALQRVLRNVQHPARRVLAQHLLHIAWMERQQWRLARQARRRAAAAAYKAPCDVQQQRQSEMDTAGGPHSASPLAELPTSVSTGAALSPNHPSTTQAPAPSQPLAQQQQPPSRAARGRSSAPAATHSPFLSPAGGTKTATSASDATSAVVQSTLAAQQSPSDRTSWLPAAVAISTSSSVPRAGSYGDPNGMLTQHQQQQQQQQLHAQPYHGVSPSVLSFGASSLPRPPPSGSVAGGSGSGGHDAGSNANTHASSISTSYALSCSLKHTVCVGATGKLQMNLTSSLPTSPMLHPSAMHTGGGGPTHRLASSHNAHRGLLDGLPPSADSAAAKTFNPLQRNQHQPHHHHAQVHHLSEHGDDDAGTSSDSSSSSSSSSSSGSSTSGDRIAEGRGLSAPSAGGAAAKPAKRPTIVSSSRSIGSSDSHASSPKEASSPVSFQKKSSLRGSRARRSADSSSRSASHTSSASTSLSESSTPPSSPNTGAELADPLPHSLPTLLITSAQALQPGVEHVTNVLRGAAVSTSSTLATSSLAGPLQRGGEGRTALSRTRERAERSVRVADVSLSDVPKCAAPCTVKSRSSTGPQPANASGVHAGAAREKKKRTPKPSRGTAVPRVFAPTDAELAQAAAAALCALAKFGSTSVSSVQAEMRRMPVWMPSFNHWSERCVSAMVEVAVLNNWLEDVSQ